MPEWWAEEFGPDYAVFLEAITDPAKTEAEARGCISLLGLKEGDRVLDLGCGFGRHAKALAQYGIKAVGVDFSPALLKRARELAGEGLAPNYVRASMHQLPFAGAFDAVISIYTSFGYFEDPAENRKTIEEAARALHPGGHLLLDTASPVPLYAHPDTNKWVEAGSLTVCEEGHFNIATGRNKARIKWYRDGRWYNFFHEEYLYAPSHLAELAETGGLEVVGIYSGLAGENLTPDSARNILVAKKPA